MSASQLAASLVGGGVSISNATVSGSPEAAGAFTGGSDILGLGGGVVLSSGKVQTVASDPQCQTGVEGPNDCDGNSTEFGTPGDPDLDTLSGGVTNDASVLSFDFVPSFSTVEFTYVFGSEEYNEFVGQFNDVFGFFVNGTNCALLPDGSPVSINDVNLDENSSLYRDNDPDDGPPMIDAQADGLTTVLTCTASVHPDQTNHIKLAVADALDEALDSEVFIGGGSLISGTQITTSLVSGATSGPVITVPAGSPVHDTAKLAGANASSATGSVRYALYSDDTCTTQVASLGTKPVSGGHVPDSDSVSLNDPGTYYAQAAYSGDSQNNGDTSTCTDETVTVTGTTGNRPPVVDAGADGDGLVGQPITLNGSATDPDGDPLTVQWSVPDGVPCTFSAPTSLNTTITCSVSGFYTATLTVSDGVNAPVSDTAEVMVEDSTGSRLCMGRAPTPGVTVVDGVITGTPGNDVIVGTNGDDRIDGRGGHDVICGKAGNDIIHGEGIGDVVSGGPGNDTITGDHGGDSLFGGTGDDHIRGGYDGGSRSPVGAHDHLSGGDGNDVLVGMYGADHLSGNKGNDVLVGGQGSDHLYGGNGDDTLYGNSGSDRLNGQAGTDTCKDPQFGTFISCEVTGH